MGLVNTTGVHESLLSRSSPFRRLREVGQDREWGSVTEAQLHGVGGQERPHRGPLG